MSGERRRLAAIVAADVVGYSRLMGRDESGTLARLREHRQVRLEPVVARHGGRIVKLTGDGALMEFGSAVDAVSAAVAFQQTMAGANADTPEDAAVVFRVGVHLGDLIVDGDDLYGDGVNVAARLEAEAPAGGIVVSGDVHNAVAGRLKAGFHDLGDLALKNIGRPVRAFRADWSAADWPLSAPAPAPAPAPAAPPTDEALPLPDKPSIAVLPFTNMSGDPEQEYFADGMTEDILTALSRFRNLFVTARNSSFTYKGRAVDIKDVGRELGVRYVLEGSVRSAGGRIRVTAQLIEAATGHHVWAERYDRRVDDIFDIQDELTARIVSAIDFEVRAVEAERPPRRTGADLGAWSAFHRGFPLLFRLTAEGNGAARALFDALVRTHPDFAPAHAALAWARITDWIYDLTDDKAAAVAGALVAAREAVALDDKDAFAHTALGRTLLIAGQRDGGVAELEKAVARNANSTHAQLFLGAGYVSQERFAEGLVPLDAAIRLSPRDPGLWSFHMWKAYCHEGLGDLDRAIDSARRAVHERPDMYLAHLALAITLADAGRLDEAAAELDVARRQRPGFSVATLGPLQHVFMPPRLRASQIDALRRLGLPE